MIEINLVPDVKQELINAQRTRSLVITIAIITGIVAVGVAVLLGVWTFGIQTARGYMHDRTITDEHAKLVAVEDIESSLTIQNQLYTLPIIHEGKYINSRVFDVISAISPSSPNTITISKTTVNTEDGIITLEAQASNGFLALEAFKKTISATNLQYINDGETMEIPLTDSIRDGDRSYGQDSTGKRVLRFTISFTYPEELFQPYLQSVSLVGPTRTNVTDSHLGVPHTLFAPKAGDEKEGDS